MDPWRVDAAEVDLSVEEIQDSDLILRTVQIERFLGSDHRDTIAVVGPIRHSFGRPRDLMVIGGAVANIAPDRRVPVAVKMAVNQAAAKGEQYTRNLNRFNIIGQGVSWRRSSDGYFVLNADVVGFSEIMKRGVESEVFVTRFEELVKTAGSKCHYAEVGEGDRALIIDQSAARVMDAIREVASGVQGLLPRRTDIRIGGGFWGCRFRRFC